ncbi:MAG: hypothetical protein ABIK28_12650, partial [Planctomycetota bacterium]
SIMKFRIWIMCIIPVLTLLSFTAHVSAEQEIVAFKVKAVMKSGMQCEAVISSKTFLPAIKKNEMLDLAGFDPESRISLYYIQGLNGSMTVAIKDVKSIKGIDPLTEGKLAEFTGKVTQRIRKADEELGIQKEQSKAQKPADSKDSTVSANKEARSPVGDKAEEKELKWLKLFPLEEGWKPESKQELYKRGITVGVYPNEKEQEFLNHYDDWMSDYRIFEARMEKEEKEKEQVRQDTEKEKLKWLARFPVKNGWGPGRKILILRNLEDAGLQPGKEEQEFLDHYSEWNAEYNDWLKNSKRR